MISLAEKVNDEVETNTTHVDEAVTTANEASQKATKASEDAQKAITEANTTLKAANAAKVSAQESATASAGSASAAASSAFKASGSAVDAAASAKAAEDIAAGLGGFDGTAASVKATDTQGLVVAAGADSNAQALLDALAHKVALELVSNTDLAAKLADYVAKTDIVQAESTATNKVPSSAYLKKVKEDINSNLADKLLIKNTTLWSGKNYADDYRAESMIFYCNPVQGNLTAYNFPVNETGVFKSIVCNQFVSQTYITINNALYQRIAADSSSPFSAWELK